MPLENTPLLFQFIAVADGTVPLYLRTDSDPPPFAMIAKLTKTATAPVIETPPYDVPSVVEYHVFALIVNVESTARC